VHITGHLFDAVKSAFSEAGTGSFWSQQRDTNGHSDRSSNLENLNSDDMIAGNSITGSAIGALPAVQCPADCGISHLSACADNVHAARCAPFLNGESKPPRAEISQLLLQRQR
jgi:hypothetical protein